MKQHNLTKLILIWVLENRQLLKGCDSALQAFCRDTISHSITIAPTPLQAAAAWSQQKFFNRCAVRPSCLPG